jgi:hypothetical protein
MTRWVATPWTSYREDVRRSPSRKSPTSSGARVGGQNAAVATSVPKVGTVGRPTKLTPATIDALVFHVALGRDLSGAARAAGCSPRSLRRWLRAGRRELDALSTEARLVLKLERAAQDARALDWRQAAARLEASDRAWVEFAGAPR